MNLMALTLRAPYFLLSETPNFYTEMRRHSWAYTEMPTQSLSIDNIWGMLIIDLWLLISSLFAPSSTTWDTQYIIADERPPCHVL